MPAARRRNPLAFFIVTAPTAEGYLWRAAVAAHNMGTSHHGRKTLLFLIVDACHAEIGKPNVCNTQRLQNKQDISVMQVPMNDVLGMHMFESLRDALRDEMCVRLLHITLLTAFQEQSQIACRTSAHKDHVERRSASIDKRMYVAMWLCPVEQMCLKRTHAASAAYDDLRGQGDGGRRVERVHGPGMRKPAP
jgi:hypothetical protein